MRSRAVPIQLDLVSQFKPTEPAPVRVTGKLQKPLAGVVLPRMPLQSKSLSTPNTTESTCQLTPRVPPASRPRMSKLPVLVPGGVVPPIRLLPGLFGSDQLLV